MGRQMSFLDEPLGSPEKIRRWSLNPRKLTMAGMFLTFDVLFPERKLLARKLG